MGEIKRFFKEESGITNVEIILIIVMVIALILMFLMNVGDMARGILKSKEN